MTADPQRLVTTVEIDVPVIEAHRLSVSALLQVELTDGRRLTLLADRGWSQSGSSDVWGTITVEEIAETTRTVVGPDEPFDDHTYEDMATDHWAALAETLGDQGVVVEPAALAALPHDVDVGPRLTACLQL